MKQFVSFDATDYFDNKATTSRVMLLGAFLLCLSVVL